MFEKIVPLSDGVIKEQIILDANIPHVFSWSLAKFVIDFDVCQSNSYIGLRIGNKCQTALCPCQEQFRNDPSLRWK